LPFAEVDSKLIDMGSAQVAACKANKDDPLRWFAIQASGQYLEYYYDFRGNIVPGQQKDEDGGHSCHGIQIEPTRVIGFRTQPGEGCEPSNIGLCLYPEAIKIQPHPEKGYKGGSVKTGLSGWRWRSFCKTQYANDPDCGGMPNFLRCHLTVVAMLDAAKEIGLPVEVSDEGEFWEKRDAKALAAEVGNWDKMIAGFFGAFKDAVGEKGLVVSAMDKRTDFERLEMAGSKDPAAANLAKLIAVTMKKKLPADGKTPTS
jgi:hypothetical protein